MEGILGLLAAPFAACLLIAGLHCYMGLHVVRRGVIFVDLALAQLAALGAASALLLGPLIFGEPLHGHLHAARLAAHTVEGTQGPAEPQAPNAEGEAHPGEPAHAHMHAPKVRAWLEERLAYLLSLLFAFLGAALFALARFRDERVPHEAIIGIVFVVSAALAVLVLSRAPHGHERMEAMLVGSILFVGWHDVWRTFLLYLPLGLLHYAVRRRLLLISDDARAAEAAGVSVRCWDLLFYATFGLMVTQSVRLAGVLVVFSYLIIPAVCATMLVEGFGRRLIVGWVVALVVSVVGLGFSALKDMPTGPSLVAVFGTALVLCAGAYHLKVRRSGAGRAR